MESERLLKTSTRSNGGNSAPEAVASMVRSWHEGNITADAFVPFAGTVLELWKSAFERVKPFQQETVRVEWVIDDEYAPAAREAEVLLALLGHLPGDEIGASLRKTLLTLTDPSLRMCALLALIRRHDPVHPSEIEPVAASHLVRIYLWNQLREMGMESLMPARWAEPDALAAAELSCWLNHPHELGTIPEEIEFMRAFPIRTDEGSQATVYLFRFREYPKPWERGEGWMAGIAGRYPDGTALGSPWSAFQSWDSMPAEAHFESLYYGTSPRSDSPA